MKTFVKEQLNPIKEDYGQSSVNNVGKVLSEGGYSFPPCKDVQGPLLYYCGNGALKRVLDIGPGYGSDTLPLLLTHNVQVIAVDIRTGQLEELKKVVKATLGDTFPMLVQSSRFATLKRNFADKNSEVPQ